MKKDSTGSLTYLPLLLSDGKEKGKMGGVLNFTNKNFHFDILSQQNKVNF